MARDQLEYRCPVCGLPCRSWDLMWGRPADENLNQELYTAVEWLTNLRLLRDQDDEVARRIPKLVYTNLEDGLFRYFDKDAEDDEDDEDAPELPPSLGRDIDVFPAENVDVDDFILFHPDGSRHHVDVNMNCNETFDQRVYLPIHASCLELAERAMKTSLAMYIKDIRAFFIALRWRHGLWRAPTLGSFFEPTYTLFRKNWYMPYYVGGQYFEPNDEDFCRLWPGPSSDGQFNMYYCSAYDPLGIPDLTDTLLSNLEECHRNVLLSREDNFLKEGLASLPPEITDQIVVYLRSSRDFDSSRKGVLPQQFWQNELILGAGGLLPWLWDIDVTKVRDKAQTPCPSGDAFEWNWELLVRQLTRSIHLDRSTEKASTWMSTAYQTELRAFPPGLYNRRRIWQLLEEMFVGDSVPMVPPEGSPRERWRLTTEKLIQLHWTKSGKLRDQPLWIPSIAHDYAFAREPGGRVIIKKGYQPIQYWQKPAPGQSIEDITPASVEEIYAVLRKLGYPL